MTSRELQGSFTFENSRFHLTRQSSVQHGSVATIIGSDGVFATKKVKGASRALRTHRRALLDERRTRRPGPFDLRIQHRRSGGSVATFQDGPDLCTEASRSGTDI